MRGRRFIFLPLAARQAGFGIHDPRALLRGKVAPRARFVEFSPFQYHDLHGYEAAPSVTILPYLCHDTLNISSAPIKRRHDSWEFSRSYSRHCGRFLQDMGKRETARVPAPPTADKGVVSRFRSALAEREPGLDGHKLLAPFPGLLLLVPRSRFFASPGPGRRGRRLSLLPTAPQRHIFPFSRKTHLTWIGISVKNENITGTNQLCT